MTPEAIALAASHLVELRSHASRAGALAGLPKACLPRSISEAYDVQEAVRTRFAGDGIAGWKIGCTTPVMQDYLAIPHPCAGTLYSPTVFSEHVALDPARYLQLGLECEIAVTLKDALPANPALEQMRSAIEAVMTSVEIVEHRFVDFEAAGTPTLIADDFFSVGCVIGKPNAPDALPDLGAIEGGFRVNGQPPRARGHGASILGHPLNALAWLATHAHGRGTPLAAGALVTLGSVVKTIYPQPGDEIAADFPALGQVRVSICA
jgi:2-keto-4-pentenoate hydratase